MVRLPSEYQEVEYLESTGTQWIDTGLYGGLDTFGVNFKFRVTTIEAGKYYVLGNFNQVGQCGVMRSTASSSTDVIFRYYIGTASYAIVFGTANSDIIFSNKNSSIMSDGVVRGILPNNTAKLSNSKLLLFGTGIGMAFNAGGRCYYLKIYQDLSCTALSRNFIPCYRKTDHKPGMYDLVSKTFFTNAGTGEFIVGPDVIRHDTPALVLRRRLLLNTPHIETASGSIATFNTDMVGKLKECKIYFEPVQEGSGDPSPDNVRPITGWTGCEVTVSPTTQSSDSTTIPLDWTDEAGTVYGGYVDLVKGEVVAKCEHVRLLSSSAEVYYYNNMRGASFSGVLKHYYNHIRESGYCSHTDKVGKYYTINSIWPGVNNNYVYWIGIFNVLGLSALADFKTWLDTQNVQLTYKLATPIHYPIDPVTLKTLRGTNNIFANTNGNAEVKFYTH